MALQGMLALPTELLQEIGGYLGDDINSLWMSHRRIYDALSPVVFRCITIDIRRTSLEAGLSMLTLLSMKSAHWAGYVKKLKIKAISPHYPILEKRYAIYGALRYPLVESEDLGWLDLFEREIEEHLGPAICSLENVTEVE
ncbi:hypothetical protein VNI00_015598 [Paramarasmius palmivorus]|uniref:F-box domain-containing protein n=1 Tax=Paramarasmius palmivorus TaxID=297713 RepID=A0AAW0BKK0_9AGAR